MIRTSDYNIYIPILDSNKFIIIHGYSGAVDVVNKNIVDFLLNYDNKNYENINPNVFNLLIKRSYLTEKTTEEEEEYICNLSNILYKASKGASFLFIPTYDCQLRCPYCYELLIRSKGKIWLKKTMSMQLVDLAFQAMLKIQDDAKKHSITLYGGEPLIAENLKLIEYIVKRGLDSGYTFDCITNGVDLHAFLHLLDPNKIHTLQITIDGPQEIHDKRRFSNNGGTFNKIIENIFLALQKKILIRVRTNVDKRNLSHLWKLAKFYSENGLTENKYFIPYIDPVSNWVENIQLSRLELTEYINKNIYKHPELKIFQSDFNVGHLFLSLLKKGKYPSFNPVYCGSSKSMYIFDPYGDIYACWEVVGREESHSKIGKYAPKLKLLNKELKFWHDRTIANITECRKCPYALICGGGCPYRALTKFAFINKPSCDEFKELFNLFAPATYLEWKKSLLKSEVDRTESIKNTNR